MEHDTYIDIDHLSREQLQSIYSNSADILIFSKFYHTNAITNRYYMNSPVEMIFIMSEVITNTDFFKETILPSIVKSFEQTGFSSIQQLKDSPFVSWVVVASPGLQLAVREMSNLLFEGNILCSIPSLKVILSINSSQLPVRTPEESSSEPSIRGPKDGFVEDISTNIALIRKRIRNKDLTVATYSIGTFTETKLALLYINSIANDELIQVIKDRIADIDVDQLVTSGQLEELIGDSTYLFPTVDYSSRTDFIAENLLNGRFVLILDNNPMAIIAPGNFFSLLKSPEDSYFPLFSSNVGHLFRITALLISIFIPSFYIAICTFHPDQLPFTLLATIALSRTGIPMEASIEMFLIMTFMELFREASIRMPSTMAQTITVVGGLIMGEAAIRAGIVSPIIIVVAAISIITGATLVNQSLTSSVVFFRFLAFIFGSTLGVYGFIIAYILFLLFLSRLHSFGVPYLAPLSPFNFKSFLISVFQVPLRYRIGRPSYLHTKKTKKDDS